MELAEDTAQPRRTEGDHHRFCYISPLVAFAKYFCHIRLGFRVSIRLWRISPVVQSYARFGPSYGIVVSSYSKRTVGLKGPGRSTRTLKHRCLLAWHYIRPHICVSEVDWSKDLLELFILRLGKLRRDVLVACSCSRSSQLEASCSPWSNDLVHRSCSISCFDLGCIHEPYGRCHHNSRHR